MTSAAHGSWANITFGIRADNEGDEYGWKQFSDVVTLSTTYDKPPNKPGDLKTSPGTSCTASPPTTVGDGDVTLYATLSDPLGSNAGSLTADVYVTDDATGKAVSGSPFKFTGLGNGSLVTELLTESVLKGLAGTTITKFSWYVTATDGTLTSPDSTTCNFNYDPTAPGAPSVCPQAGCNAQPPPTYEVGTPASFVATPNAAGVKPDSYTYQVNGAAPQTKAADTSGGATITVTPVSGADALTVTAVSAGGNVGQSATVFFTASAKANAADGDMTGDGIPDLVTPGGGSTGLAPGLWLAEGQSAPGGTAGDGQLISSPADVGAEGDGIAGDYSPDDFTGSQVITGLFSDNGFQDSLIYFPPGSGNYATAGVVLDGTGDGTIRDDQNMYASGDSALTTQIPAGSLADAAGDSPLQIANGYNADPSDNAAYSDLIAISGDNSATGYYLEYFQNASTAGSWANPDTLSAETPDGTMDWNDWQITTMQDPAGYTDMFLYNAATKALYLWQDFTVNNFYGTVGYTQYELSSDWAPGPVSELRAADITGTGPALWAVTTTGTATAWITSGLSATAGTGTITAQPAQSLLSATHAWHLGDGTTGTAATAADTGGGTSLPLTGNSGVTWNTGDLFNPDADFNGTSGAMTSSTQVLNTTGNWSVSAWVKPAALGGIVLSQYGTEASCLRISIATTITNGITTGSWRLATTNANSATATSVLATAGDTYNVQVGTWAHLTATYDSSAGFLRLYIDGIPAASATTTATWSSGCNTFALGQWRNTGGNVGGYFNGQIADVQAWNGTALSPTEAAALSGTPGYTLFPSDSTQYTSAASSTTWQWSTASAEMNFYQGTLTVKDTGTKSTTTTFGTSGYPSAVLTLQRDGNLVIYANAADATAGNTGALWAA
ncbi:MAG: LamG domain-containing protein, partial [Trebonia sp.]